MFLLLLLAYNSFAFSSSSNGLAPPRREKQGNNRDSEKKITNPDGDYTYLLSDRWDDIYRKDLT